MANEFIKVTKAIDNEPIWLRHSQIVSVEPLADNESLVSCTDRCQYQVKESHHDIRCKICFGMGLKINDDMSQVFEL
jgi:hypothetical protein